MMFFLGIAVTLLFVWWASSLKVEECPRDILGYNCKGKDCDHSEKAVKSAKSGRSRND